VFAGLESLPVELQRNFKLMRDLDGRAQTLMQEIDVLGEEYLKVAKTSSSDRKKELSSNIQVGFYGLKQIGWRIIILKYYMKRVGRNFCFMVSSVEAVQQGEGVCGW